MSSVTASIHGERDEVLRDGTHVLVRAIHPEDIELARGIKSMHSSDAADNTRMRQFADQLHFQHRRDPADSTRVLYSIDLGSTDSASGARAAQP